jgi:hypothetical protein
MGVINFSNSKGRDAVVNTETVRSPLRVRWLDAQGRSTRAVRLIRSTSAHDTPALVRQAGSLEQVVDLLVQGDPELDIETFGKEMNDTSRVYIGQDGAIMHRVQELEVVRNPDGSERERRPRRPVESNTATETPLKWSGKMMKKSEVYNRFVFATKLQIVHVNGLTYDFLHQMAKELEAADSVMLVGAGPKSANPLVFQRNGTPYRGFLEGRTQGDKYCLVLHLSNMELKAPAAPEVK